MPFIPTLAWMCAILAPLCGIAALVYGHAITRPRYRRTGLHAPSAGAAAPTAHPGWGS